MVEIKSVGQSENSPTAGSKFSDYGSVVGVFASPPLFACQTTLDSLVHHATDMSSGIEVDSNSLSIGTTP